MTVENFDARRSEFGLEATRRFLRAHDVEVAPGTYDAYLNRPVSATGKYDARLLPIDIEVHREDFFV